MTDVNKESAGPSADVKTARTEVFGDVEAEMRTACKKPAEMQRTVVAGCKSTAYFRVVGFRPSALCGDGLSPLGAHIAHTIGKHSALHAGFFQSF
ncbi:hypothetical protein NDU88_000998 [Pleurodeles waltl]|uniref:Uncharacterized protein n=1 Tax=Pleurodeles waltl TaxID=8319 RepID=A0AAV7WMB0_PLEWA|nr:hypothetical protein NDU88_000998 [Pleurodeles waltl]